MKAVTARYGRIKKKNARIILNTWYKEGVPENLYDEPAHEFVTRHQLQKLTVNTATEEVTSPLCNS